MALFALTVGDWRPLKMSDLKKFKPPRPDLKFTTDKECTRSLPPGDFETLFGNLFKKCLQAVNEIFEKRTSANIESLCFRDFPAEFSSYADKVATSDPSTGGWDRILSHGMERHYFITAILMRFLASKCFDSLLFGASKDELKSLESQDTSTVHMEGFKRTRLRSLKNQRYIETCGGLPPHFWEEVDSVAAQLLQLLLPIYNCVGWAGPHEVSKPQKLHSLVHDLVAHAAEINLRMRVSTSVFKFNWACPGAHISPDSAHHVNLHNGLYEYSRVKAAQDDGIHDREPECRLARVKIVVTPEVMMNTPVISPTLGRTVHTVMRSSVIYYQGFKNSASDFSNSASFKQHLQAAENKNKAGRGLLFVLILSLQAIVFSWTLQTAVRRHLNKYPAPEP